MHALKLSTNRLDLINTWIILQLYNICSMKESYHQSIFGILCSIIDVTKSKWD